MPRGNIKYRSKELVGYYKRNRQRWKDLYPSERRVFEKIASGGRDMGDVLDVGCACGGLGCALREKGMIRSYTGIDINKDVIVWARKNRKTGIPMTFITGDIIDAPGLGSYDTVISLGCADWNVETKKIIFSCWKKVKKGGSLIISLRVTPEKGINDIRKSFQHVNFSGAEKEPEIANYVVLNLKEALELLKGLKPAPESIGAYGYWGKPSSTAVTPFEKIVFSVFYLKKQTGDSGNISKLDLELPIS